MGKPSIDYLKYPESEVIVNHIYERFRKGLYTHIPVTGLPGTGKSSTCQRLAELTYLRFGDGRELCADDIVDSLLDFLKRLKAVKGPGEIIIIEELSVLFPSRRAMAKENVAIGRILDTCRKKQVILFTNAPIFTSIDSHVRAMSHILIETQKIIKSQKVVVSKTWRLQTNPHTGKTYRHRFRRDDGKDVSLIYTQMPGTDTWNSYEKKKDVFMDELYSDLTREQQKKKDKRDKDNGKHLDGKDANYPSSLHWKRYDMNKRGLTQYEIADLEGVKQPRISESINKCKEFITISQKNKDNPRINIITGPVS